MRGSDLDACIAAALRGLPTRWPWPDDSPAATDEAIKRIELHGISAQLVAAGRDLSGWPSAVVDAIREEARLQAIWEPVHRAAVAAVVEALYDQKIDVLVLKGTALAYSIYDEPEERRRGDTDMLVRRADMDRARHVLGRLGWRTGQRQAFQESWTIPESGFLHELDLHWRLRNVVDEPPAISVEACLASAGPLPKLHAAARTTDPATTLVNCALNHAAHRVYGYGAGQRGELLHLGGVADIDRLVRGWTRADWINALDLAREIGAGRVLAAALGQARRWLETPIAPWALARLDEIAAAEAGRPDPWSEPPSGPSVARLGAKLRAAAGWRAKRDVMLARLLPSAGELGLTAEEARRPAALYRARLARLRRIARRIASGPAR